MPVEIKELIIKAEFGLPRDKMAAAQSPDSSPQNQSEIIQECVRQVLDALERKKER